MVYLPACDRATQAMRDSEIFAVTFRLNVCSELCAYEVETKYKCNYNTEDILSYRVDSYRLTSMRINWKYFISSLLLRIKLL